MSVGTLDKPEPPRKLAIGFGVILRRNNYELTLRRAAFGAASMMLATAAMTATKTAMVETFMVDEYYRTNSNYIE
jgi:hypothetical protein